MSDDQVDYIPLCHELNGYFDVALADLPDELRERVMEAYRLFSWDELDTEQRRYRAEQYDQQHDPGWEVNQQFAIDLLDQLHGIQREAAEWSKVAVSSATDLKKQQDQLQQLSVREAHFRAVVLRLDERDFPKYQLRRSLSLTDTQARLMSLNSTEDFLMSKLGASPEEIAAWVDMGSEAGGLDAFLGNWPLEQFYFKPGMSMDYLGELYLCRFLEAQVAKFSPGHRVVTGRELIENMLSSFGARARAYAIAQISEGSLLDFHPTRGVTDAGVYTNSGFPALEEGLFFVSQVVSLSRRDGWALHWPKRLANVRDRLETPAQRKERLAGWFDEEVRLRGSRGASTRVAERERVTRQVIERILKRD